MSLTGLVVLAVNLACTPIRTRFRSYDGRLTRAAFLSVREDALVNHTIIAAAYDARPART